MKLVLNKSVASYLETFRNIVIAIPDILEAEKLNQFLKGLKPLIRLEAPTARCDNVNVASWVALNVGSALYGAGMFYGLNAFDDSGPQPTEIRNFQGNRHYRGKSLKRHKVDKNSP